MSGMQQHFVKINDHEIHVRTWNATACDTVFCSHGFTNNSADFLVLAESLAQKGYRVIAPDILGRGLSQWSNQPTREYNLTHYAKITIKIINHFKCKSLHWVGCDMGGLIGILLASNDAYQHLFHSMTLNDIGPEIPKPIVESIIKAAGKKRRFTQFQEALRFLEKKYFPICPDQKIWQLVCESSLRRLSLGGFTLHYDNNIFLASNGSTIKLWHRFSNLNLPIMTMCCQNSDILTKSILNKMRKLQPQLAVNHYLGCQNTPSLLNPSYCQDILSFIQNRSSENRAAPV